MTEPTLLQQARSYCDACDGQFTHGARITSLRNSVHRILQHLEQREAAMRGPAQVPDKPKCKVCGGKRDVRHEPGSYDADHAFEPDIARGGWCEQHGAFQFCSKCPECPANASHALDIDELQRLCDAATPGPWNPASMSLAGTTRDGRQYALDHKFVAAARDALPKLIARVKVLERRIAKVNDLGNEFANDPATALRCIGEALDLAEHYDRHPNAPRDHG